VPKLRDWASGAARSSWGGSGGVTNGERSCVVEKGGVVGVRGLAVRVAPCAMRRWAGRCAASGGSGIGGLVPAGRGRGRSRANAVWGAEECCWCRSRRGACSRGLCGRPGSRGRRRMKGRYRARSVNSCGRSSGQESPAGRSSRDTRICWRSALSAGRGLAEPELSGKQRSRRESRY
jgi:hypothetical protein